MFSLRAKTSALAMTRPARVLTGRTVTSALMSTAKLSLEELSERQCLRGKRVLVRADLNVPFKKNQSPQTISDDTRIRAVLPTLQLLQYVGAKTILCSHLGRPDGQVNDDMRLTPVAARLGELLGRPVKKLDDCIGDEVTKEIDAIQEGEIVLLENVRFYKQETKNDPEFAKKLAHNADVFVNDAFGTAHRAHASTAGVTKYIKTSVAGFLMEKELKYLAGAVESPERPLGAIIGGAKVRAVVLGRSLMVYIVLTLYVQWLVGRVGVDEDPSAQVALGKVRQDPLGRRHDLHVLQSSGTLHITNTTTYSVTAHHCMCARLCRALM